MYIIIGCWIIVFLLIASSVISFIGYLSEKIKQKRSPGTCSFEKMHMCMSVFIASSAFLGVILLTTFGVGFLLSMALRNM